jgi:TatD DNase family protein
VRTTAAATSDAANLSEAPEPIYDTLFRDSKGRIIEPPKLHGAPVADTHTHLDMLHHPDLALARCAAHNVDYVVTVIDPTEDPAYTLNNLETWRSQAANILQQWECDVTPPQVRIIIGCHPHNAAKYNPPIEAAVTQALDDPRTAAIGEIGLDYHYDMSPRDVQQRVFRRQIQLAHEHNTPIILHLREAHDEGLRILQEEGLPAAGVLLHCFNLDYATLEPFLELGCMVAYGGPITFKKSDSVRDAARRTPLDRIVSETDAPFMAPHPLRGTICGPEDTVFSVAKLVEVFEVADKDVAHFCRQLHQNARRFFGV